MVRPVLALLRERGIDIKSPVIWNFLVALIIIGAAFGANMLPSKRGHQD